MHADINLRTLRAFVVLAEELHFGRTAARLHVTQPALTRTIQALETALGVQLVDRSTRQVQLTLAGNALNVDARRLLSDVQMMQERVRAAAEGRHRTVRLGVIESASMTRMPSVLSEFRQRYPQVHLLIHDLHSVEQLRRIKDHELDWGVVRGLVSDPDFESAIAYDDPLVAAVPENAFAGTSRIDLRELEDESLVLYDRSLGTAFMSAVGAACAQVGFTPRVTMNATSTPMLLSIVSEGSGIGIVSEAVAATGAEGIRFLRIENPTISAPILLVWRRGESSPEVEALLEILRDSTYRGIS